MENSYWYRYFLMCNELANRCMGHQYQNFAELIVDEDNGRYMNSQMTKYFYVADEFFSGLLCNDIGLVLDELGVEELAKIPPEQLQKDFTNYCDGKLKNIYFEDCKDNY